METHKKRTITATPALPQPPVVPDAIINDMLQVLSPERMIYYLGEMFECFYLQNECPDKELKEGVYYTYYALKETLYKMQQLVEWRKANGMYYNGWPLFDEHKKLRAV